MTEQPPYDPSAAIAAFQQVVKSTDDERMKLLPAFQIHFNALAKSLPMATYDDKKKSLKILNKALRSRGFAVKCPRTDIASLLQMNNGDHPETGRFQFVHYTKEGDRVVTASRNDLPEFEIVLEDLSLVVQQEPETWAEKKAPRRKRGENRRE